MVGTPLFTHMSITFSKQRLGNCSPTLDVGFVKLTLLTLDRVGQFSWKQGLQDEYSVPLSCHLCCSSSVIFQNNPQPTTISFCQYWFSPTVPLRWCIPMICVCWYKLRNCRSQTLETVALDTPNNVVVFVTYAPAERTRTISPLSKSDKSPTFRVFYTNVTPQLITHPTDH
jgi:hypothetical protein